MRILDWICSRFRNCSIVEALYVSNWMRTCVDNMTGNFCDVEELDACDACVGIERICREWKKVLFMTEMGCGVERIDWLKDEGKDV